MATNILEFLPTLLYDDKTLGFVIPIANNMRLLDSGMLAHHLYAINYGDLVNLKFWKLLNIKIGKPSSPEWYKEDGFLYKYYVVRRKFTVTDSSGSVIHTKENVTSMGDMGIDFSIYKSHQFMIIIEESGNNFKFYIPARDKHISLHASPESIDSVGNKDNNDNITPYSIYSYWHKEFVKYEKYNSYTKYTKEMIGLLNLQSQFKFDNHTCFYLPTYDTIEGDMVQIVYRGKALDLSKALWAMLCDTLFPNRYGIMRTGEISNNRPLYEPWLIWGILEFLYNHRTEDLDHEYPFEILDLSPNYSY